VPPTILDRILVTKRAEIAAAQVSLPWSELRRLSDQAPPVRDFLAAIAQPGPVKLIAEVKKASPSKGVIRADFDPVWIARTYADHGATCLSVLTDSPYFQGHLDHLRAIRRTVNLPLLRKDFIIDAYQVWEARAAGADAVLLIAECLDDHQLSALHAEICQLGMTPLVELYEPENLPRVVELGTRLIGVNNRDLRTFEVDLNHTIRMRARIPADRLVVGESGIRTHEDLVSLERSGVNAVLVGESLMAQSDLGLAVERLLHGRTRP
jgi:indole-3-glycerol phosphate synthase